MHYNSVCNHTGDYENRTTANRESDLLIHQEDDYRQLDDMKSYCQLIINIIFSADHRKAKKLVNSETSPFYEFV